MIRIAVLGAGRIGKIHARNVAQNPRCRLIAVSDSVAEAARALADSLGCEASTDPEATVARGDVDAIVIGTPTDTHVDFMLDAARRGKAVLCEKPVDLDISKVDAAAAEVDKRGARVMVAFNRRFDPSAAALKQAIQAGEVGEVRQVIITSRDPAPPPLAYIATSGGIFRDMMIHDFDMARWLLGEEPTEVTAIASCLVDPGIGSAGDYDTLMVNMKTASGRQCHINNCRQSVYGYDQRLEVFGSRGMVLNDNLRPTTLRRYNESETEAREPLLNFFLERYADAYRIELDSFVDAAEAGGPMPVTIRDGRQALRLADAALESAGSGRTVRV
ncbi:MAG: myo-inositol 2-dehydrogenase / D-chiro-inositol 1-dehydrogenase [Rhodospirillaceae bacterium]|jgi:myo-inositol 2-dehydrogenase/D-chiro-inositol 1-dehydrogenase|nr:myo-inositol 2-dehydrogenase / D-chiro-inositol 1-dehydrogenase [Rhodospirillaceae bacterium]